MNSINFSLEEAIEIFKGYYSHLGNPIEIKPLENQGINSFNYYIKTQDREILLRKYGDFQSYQKKEKVQNSLDFIIKCKEIGVKVPNVIASSDNKILIEENNSFYTCFEYIQGTHNFNKEDHKALKSVASSLSNLHKAAKEIGNYGYETQDISSELLDEETFEKIKQKLTQYQEHEQNDFLKLVKEKIAYIKQLTKENNQIFDQTNLPLQLIHADFHPQNIIFEQDQVKAILDFDAIKYSQRVREVGFEIQRFCDTKEQAQIFLESYNSQNQLNQEETIHLKDITIRESLRRISKIISLYVLEDNDIFVSDLPKQLANLEKTIQIF